MAVTLKRSARAFLAIYVEDLSTYEETARLLRSRYCNKGKNQRLLNEWEAMKLITWMHENPYKSELIVLQDLVSRAM